VLAGLGGITVAAWVYVVVAARRMASGSADTMGDSMAPMMDAMTGLKPWTATEFGLRLAMWAAMMVAMMIPTAAPASNTAQGLAAPRSPARTEGSPKTPLPIIEFTTSATKLHRPIACTSPA